MAMSMTDLVGSVTGTTDMKMSTISIFIDLRKAFNTINYNMFIKKLQHYGIRGIASK